MATTGRDRQHIFCTAFLPSGADDETDPTVRRRVVFNAAIQIAELLAKNGRIAVTTVSDERGEGIEYQLRCDVVMNRDPAPERIGRFSQRDQEEEAARCEMMLLLAQHPGPCGKRLLEEKGDTSWVDTLAEAKRRAAAKHAARSA